MCLVADAVFKKLLFGRDDHLHLIGAWAVHLRTSLWQIVNLIPQVAVSLQNKSCLMQLGLPIASQCQDLQLHNAHGSESISAGSSLQRLQHAGALKPEFMARASFDSVKGTIWIASLWNARQPQD